jgi:molybdopterin converting factor small subunit
MTVSVSFMGLQRTLADTDTIQVTLEEGKRVSDVLDYVRCAYPELPFPDGALLIVVNDRVAPLKKTLRSKDRVTFLPALGGG